MSYPPPNSLLQQTYKLDDDMFGQLRKFIYERTGIFFADNKKYLLESRLNRRLTALGLDTFNQYLRTLTNGQGAAELVSLVNAVTINETFFFRNEPQFKALEDLIIPDLVAKRKRAGGDRIRIWSAASSTGEEPHTIALIMKEKVQILYPSMKFEIVGSDINSHVLDTARAGVYREYAIRNIPKNYLDKYFIHEQDRYILKDEILKMTEFKYLNLFDKNAMRTMRGFDVIFAANVLIYFDFNSKQSVVSSIYDSLNPGGYFFVGYSETLYGLSQAFKPVHFDKAIAYRKE